MIRLPGTEHLPLSPRTQTDGTFFEPFSEEWIERHPHTYDIAVLVKDGRIFGGKDFSYKYHKDDEVVVVFRDAYLGGGSARIPVDEIMGIRSGYIVGLTA